VHYEHVVIAVDGSEASLRAARHGLELAGTFDATVEVVHVVERRALALASDEEVTRLRERGEAVLAEVSAVAAERGQSVSTTLLEGRPAARIVEHAAGTDAPLVVLGRQGLTGLGRRLLGGVTERLLHRSSVPVLVVPGSDDVPAGGYDRLLLPTDGSENAAAAIEHGVAVARDCGCAVDVLNVVDIQGAGGLFGAGGLDDEFLDRLESRGREAVDGVAARLDESAPELSVTTAVRRTSSFEGAAAGIREYAAEHDVDLIVMASRGRSNLGRQLLGSVASAVLRTVDVPVLVVGRSRD
jgi:nucleotide-binding universal stress UspA family protein